MSGELTGNVNNQLHVDEHEPLASAKKVVPKHVSETSGLYVGPTCQEYTDTIPLNVVLCDPTGGSGTPYAASGGGVGGNVTAYIAAGVTLDANVGVASSVTIHTLSGIAASVTLDANVGISSSVTIHTLSGIAASVTLDANVGISSSVTLYAETPFYRSGTTLFTARHCGVDTTYLVADANLNRVSISIGLHNPSSTAKLFLGPSAAMSTGNAPIQVNAGQSWDEWGDGIYTGEWYGIASNVTATAHRWDRSAT